MSLSTPIRRARGLGAAGEGVEHFKMQRLTAIANVPLVLWFVLSMVAFQSGDYDAARAWLAQPLNTALTLLLIASVFYHARLGLQVIVEDYIHHKGTRLAALVVIPLACVALGTACAVAVLNIAL